MPVTIKQWRDQAVRQLTSAGINSARLDAEILLAHTLNKSRTYIHAYHEDVLTPRQREIADARLALRTDRIPLAYIIGHKEFYKRQFLVTTAVLIPRPESEEMIECLRDIYRPHESVQRLVDVGTGSGCLGITAKLELPDLEVMLLDISKHALNVAEKNAKRLRASVTTSRSDLLDAYPYRADYILANLPYVDKNWERSPETDHEPGLALFAADQGLSLIKRLVDQLDRALTEDGYVFLEADPRQFDAISAYAQSREIIVKNTKGFIMVLARSMSRTHQA